MSALHPGCGNRALPNRLLLFLYAAVALAVATSIPFHQSSESYIRFSNTASTTGLQSYSSVVDEITIFVGNYLDSIANSSLCSTMSTSTLTSKLNSCNIRSALSFCFKSLTKKITDSSSLTASVYTKRDGTVLENVFYLNKTCHLILGTSSTHHVNQLTSESDLLSPILENFLSSTSFNAVSSSSSSYFFLPWLKISSSSLSGSPALITSSSQYANMRFLTLEGTSLIPGLTNLFFVMRFAMENLRISSFGSSSLPGGALHLSAVFDSSFENITLSSNAASSGGALYLDECSHISFANLAVKDNSAFSTGGGIYLNSNNTNINFTNSVIRGNTVVGGDGGGIYLYYGNTNISFTNSDVNTNLAGNTGGGILLGGLNSYILITGCSIKYNSAFNGGGVFFYESNDHISVIDSYIANNTVHERGGGVFVSRNNGFLTFSDCHISGNRADAGDGGGLYIYMSNEYIEFNDCDIKGNQAISGGGVYVSSSNSHIAFLGSTIRRNSASKMSGGGIYLYQSNSDITIMNTNVNSNGAVTYGGGIYLGDSNIDVSITNSQFSYNYVLDAGAGIFVSQLNSFITITDSTFVANNAIYFGGGIHLSYNNYMIAIVSSFFGNNTASSGGAAICLYQSNFLINITSNSMRQNFVSGGSGAGLFLGLSNSVITVTDTVISYNKVAYYGGGIYIDVSNNIVSIGSSTIENNVGNVNGGGIYVNMYNYYITVENTQIICNSAVNGNGGGVYFYEYNHDILFTQSDVSNNSAAGDGGAFYLYVSNYKFTIEGSNICQNIASSYGSGGALFLGQSNFIITIADTIISYNKVAYYGGGIYIGVSNNIVSIGSSTVIENNVANVNGGGIYVNMYNYYITVENTQIICNSAVNGNGGGVYFYEYNHDILFTQSDVSNNSAVGDGGAFYLYVSNYKFTIEELTINHNVAVDGPAMFLSDSNYQVNIIDSNISWNAASGGMGAGILLDLTNFEMNIIGTNIRDNSAATYGGGVYLGTGNYDILFSTSSITDNTAGSGGGIYLSQSNYRITFASLTIQSNIASSGDGGGVYLLLSNSFITFSMSDICGNSANSGGGGGMYLSQTNYHITIIGSSVCSNTAVSNGGGVSLSQSNYLITFTNFKVHDNSAYFGGGIYIYGTNYDIAMSECNVSHNTAYDGGGVYLSQYNNNITIARSIINNNSVTSYGGALALLIENYDILIENTVIKGNVALDGDGAGVHLYQGNYDVTLKSCNLSDNTASSSGGALYVGSTNHDIYVDGDTTFSNNSAASAGGAVAVFQGNYAVHFQSLTFTANSALFGGSIFVGLQNYDMILDTLVVEASQAKKYGGGALYIDEGNTNISVTSSFFRNNSAVPYGGAVSFNSKNYGISFDECVFENNIASLSGGAFSVYTLNGQQDALEFGGLLGVSGNTDPITVSSCRFSSNVARGGSGGAVFSYSQNRIESTNTIFEGNQATTFGGAADMGSGSFLDVFSNCTFKANNAAGNGGGGGAVAVRSGSTLALSGSTITFTQNNANLSSGGAILVSSASTLSLNNANCSLTQNTALIGGSAIDLGGDDYVTLQGHSSMLFADNTAKVTGAPLYWIDSSDRDFSFLTEPDNLTVTWVNNVGPFAEKWSSQVTRLNALYSTYDVTKYESSVNFYQILHATDRFESINTSYTSPAAPSVSVSVADSNCGGKAGYLSGPVTATWTAGVAIFNSINAVCYPGGNLTVMYSAQIAGLSTTYTVTNTSILVFRDCVDGEILKDNKCQACSGNTYSFTFSPDTISCTSCPSNADSCYLNKINITAGYWRISPLTTSFLACLYGSKACKGGADAYGFDQSCNDGYEGPLCGVCSVGYYLSSSKCLPCTGSAGNSQLVILIVVPVLLFCLVAVFMIFFASGGAEILTDNRIANLMLMGQAGEVGEGVVAEDAFARGGLTSDDGTGSPYADVGIGLMEATNAGGIAMMSAAVAMTSYSSNRNIDATNAKSAETSSAEGEMRAGVVSPYPSDNNDVVHDNLDTRHSYQDSSGSVGMAALPSDGTADGTTQQQQQQQQQQQHQEHGQVDEEAGAEPVALAPPPVSKEPAEASPPGFWRSTIMFFGGLTTKVKILITVCQIISALPNSLQINFPASAEKLFSAMSFANFSGLMIGSPQCQMNRRFDYIDKLLAQTLVPLGFSMLIFFTMGVNMAYARLTIKQDPIELRKSINRIAGQYFQLFLMLLYLVLPSVTTTIAGTVPTINVDPSNIYPDENLYYMRNDYSISAKSSRYKFGIIWVGIMTAIYPIGVPSLYFFVLYVNRDAIRRGEEGEGDRDEDIEDRNEKVKEEKYLEESVEEGFPDRQDLSEPEPTVHQEPQLSRTKSSISPSIPTNDGNEPLKTGTQHIARRRRSIVAQVVKKDSISFLYRSYEPQFWYWEVIETIRRLLLTAVLSVVGNGTPVQIVFGIVIAVVFMKLYGYFAPYEEDDDDILQELAQYQIFITLFISLLLQSDLLPGATWSITLGVLLVITNVFCFFVALATMSEVKKRLGDISCYIPCFRVGVDWNRGRSKRMSAPQSDPTPPSPPPVVLPPADQHYAESARSQELSSQELPSEKDLSHVDSYRSTSSIPPTAESCTLCLIS